MFDFVFDILYRDLYAWYILSRVLGFQILMIHAELLCLLFMSTRVIRILTFVMTSTSFNFIVISSVICLILSLPLSQFVSRDLLLLFPTFLHIVLQLVHIFRFREFTNKMCFKNGPLYSRDMCYLFLSLMFVCCGIIRM